MLTDFDQNDEKHLSESHNLKHEMVRCLNLSNSKAK